jgi:RNA recognition motif-containing protein
MPVKLFVGGLSFSTSSERLREAFAAVGAVESASVVTDRDTGRSRGFGFVEMASQEDANAAVSRLNGTDLDGRQIKVEQALSSGRSGGGGGRGPRPGGGGGFGGGGRGGGGGGGWRDR